MRTLNLAQGSPEWLAHRRTTRNASDAPAMMGVSPYVTRAELVRQYATGVQREIDERTQAIFDRGHEVEPALRALAEKIIGEDLYPVTGVSDDGYLGAVYYYQSAKLTAQAAEILGRCEDAEHYAQLVSRFPEGVPAEEIDAIAQELAGNKTPRLSIVNGH